MRLVQKLSRLEPPTLEADIAALFAFGEAQGIVNPKLYVSKKVAERLRDDRIIEVGEG